MECVLSQDGKTFFALGIWNDVRCYKWQSERGLKKLMDERDPAHEPSCHYKIQPENIGKLVWLTGSPGSGKSVIAHLMSKEAGYVYYDGDSAEHYLNPFISPSVKQNPSKQAFRQKPLKVYNESSQNYGTLY